MSDHRSVTSGEPPNPLAQLKREGARRSQEATGTAYIFDVRANRLRSRLNRSSFFGVAVPLIIGLIVLGFGVKFKALGVIIVAGVVLSGIQVVVFTWSLVARWVDAYDGALRAYVANRSIAESYESLVREEPTDIVEYRHRLEILNAKDQAQRNDDYRQGVTDGEKRMGMRATLIQYAKECSRCGLVPDNMRPPKKAKCGVCGDFPRRWVRRR
jgi:mobilome CxxCx(11)CxxC protein